MSRIHPGTALAAALLAATAGADAETWSYRIGQERANQQGNFCTSRDDVMEIASIFERFGARTGYAALSEAGGCALEAHSFTPRELVRTVEIALQRGDSYTIRFIRVDLRGGGERHLVTTRDLAPGR